MEQISIEQFHERLKTQAVSAREHVAFKCPICSTVQSMTSLLKAGCGTEKVENYVGFSCEGRFSGSGPYPSSKDETKKAEARRKIRGCDWTLGGLFRLHKLEVIDADGKAQPMFEIATPEEAQQLERIMSGREETAAA